MKIEHRIEWNHAGAQSSFWVGLCALTGFTAILLGSKGLNDVQVGYTSSLLSVLTIAFQLIISNFSDQHPSIALRNIIAVLYLLAIASGAVLLTGGIPIALLMIMFALGGAFKGTIVGLFNALVMQYVNTGIPVRIGWPRGVASIVYALCAYTLGRLIEIYSPGILVPIFLAATLISILLILLMPDVTKLTERIAPAFQQDREASRISYRQMLSGNTPLLLFLLAGVVLYSGQTTAFLFLVRVVESRGGGAVELGISMFLQAGMEMPIMFMSPWILKRFKPGNTLVFSYFAYAFKTFLLMISQSMPVVYLAMSFNIFSFGLYCITSVYFVNDLVRAGERVRAQGLVALCGAAGSIIGSVFAGYVLDTHGIQALLTINVLVTLGSAFIMILCNKSSHGYTPRSLARD